MKLTLKFWNFGRLNILRMKFWEINFKKLELWKIEYFENEISGN